jgi:hypothetical protein
MRDTPDPTALWDEFVRRVASLLELVHADGSPGAEAQRAAGLRYLTRFLAAGLRVCVECDDPDFPRFGRMIDNAMSWGLDNPDCNYSWARIRGDASYRVSGWRGSARHLEFQVNTGHFADGRIPALGGGEDAWRTVSFLSGDTLESDADGRFEIALSAEPRAGNWLRLDPEASFLLVRQYFDDWERQEPARFDIVREGAVYPPPAFDAAHLAAHFSRLFEWLEVGARCWDRVSRLLLCSTCPTTWTVRDSTDRPTGWARSPAGRRRPSSSSSPRRRAACGAWPSRTSGGSRSRRASARPRSTRTGRSSTPTECSAG